MIQLKWLDYYKILGVDSNAELETIVTAYRRKAFEYHPDRSNKKDAQERMYEVNKAYETLKDKALRSDYDVKWIEKHKAKLVDQFHEVNLFESKMIDAAEKTLFNYFKAIQEQNYEEAYLNLFNNDLDVNTFVRWQKSVASVYRMVRFESKYVKALKNKMNNGNEIQYIAVFSVSVYEINKITGYEESEILNKSMLFSKGKWHVYLDQVNIDAVISKYNKLSEIKRRKFYLKKATLSKGSLILGIERELERYIRYGSPFSLAFFEIISKEEQFMKIYFRQKHFDDLILLIKNAIRKLDVIGTWTTDCICVLLPGSGLEEATLFRDKILRLIEDYASDNKQFTVKSTVYENEAKHLEYLLEQVKETLENWEKNFQSYKSFQSG